MPDTLKKAIDGFLLNYVNLCNETVETMRKNGYADKETILALNDSARVAVSHIRKGVCEGKGPFSPLD